MTDPIHFRHFVLTSSYKLMDLSRRSVTPRDLSNTGSPAGFPKTRANKRIGMLRIKSAMLSLCLCECGPHSPITTWWQSEVRFIEAIHIRNSRIILSLKPLTTVILNISRIISSKPKPLQKCQPTWARLKESSVQENGT